MPPRATKKSENHDRDRDAGADQERFLAPFVVSARLAAASGFMFQSSAIAGTLE